jgi:PAS domain S-box-containing protein
MSERVPAGHDIRGDARIPRHFPVLEKAMKDRPEYQKVKKTNRFVIGLIIFLLAAAITMGIISVYEMRQRISEDFNAQQLALSKHAATMIENNFKILKNELLMLSLSPSIQYVESVSWRNRMEITLATVQEYGVFRIMLISMDGTRSFSVDYNRAMFIEDSNSTEVEYFKWCADPARKNLVYAGNVREGTVEGSESGLVFDLATAVYQISPDEAHPVPTQRFAGVLVFLLDARRLAKQIVEPIRSGKTGYAWVIDNTGKFIYHLERKFIGQNAFEARKLENPHISFDKINLIQKEKMQQGKQGTSWYTSGWHRGESGALKKLIAFAPVLLRAGNAERVWSVAVVAPESEVQDTIQKLYLRQAIIQLSFTFAVLIVFYFLRSNEMIWVKALEKEVREKTHDLSEYAQRLENSEKRYRTLVESADDLIYVMDQQGNILSMNHTWKRITGQDAELVIGKHLSEIMAFENANDIFLLAQRVLMDGRPASVEGKVTVAEKTYFFDLRYNRIGIFGTPNESSLPCVLVIARDLTEHKDLESRLFNTLKLASLGELSAGVAHEINNPIAIILGFTEMLLEKTDRNSKAFEILKAIERQGENCKRIVEKLLAFARIPAKTSTEADVIISLQRVLDVVQNTLLTEKVELKTVIPSHLPKVRGDGQELEQVFLNIVTNAISAMEGGGVLTVSAKHHQDRVQIAFEDTGPGIAPKHMDKIFDPFFTTKEVGKGTGLGLSVSYGIVKKIGGEIQVKNLVPSENGHTGALFTIILPCEETRPT